MKEKKKQQNVKPVFFECDISYKKLQPHYCYHCKKKDEIIGYKSLTSVYKLRNNFTFSLATIFNQIARIHDTCLPQKTYKCIHKNCNSRNNVIVISKVFSQKALHLIGLQSNGFNKVGVRTIFQHLRADA